MKAAMGIRRRIQAGLALFCVIQFFLLVAIAIFSYHYGEDQSLNRVVESGAKILEYGSIEDSPDSLARELSTLDVGTYELSGNENASLGGLELHVHVMGDRESGLAFRVLQIQEQTKLWPLIKNYALFACMAILLLLAFGGWTARTVAQRISQPLESIADKLRESEGATEQFNIAENQQPEEIRIVARALNDAFSKTSDVMERQSTFSRNVSHELRTPLTVIHTALDQAVDSQQNMSPATIRRALQACDEMELLTGACLALARNPSADEPEGVTDMGACIKQVVRESMHLLDARKVCLEVSVPHQPLLLPVQQPLVRLVAGNMIRNAFIHRTVGEIVITLNSTGMLVNNAASDVANTSYGATVSSATPGGVGLSILDQACRRLGWRFEMDKHTETAECKSANTPSLSITNVQATIHFTRI